MSRESKYAIDATDGSVLKQLISLSVPIALANLLQVGYNLADTFWVGRLGQPAVSALGFSWAIVFLVVSLAGGFNVAGSVLVAQYTGAGDHDRADHIAGQSIAFIGVLSLLFAVGGYVTTPTLLTLVGAAPETEAYRLAVTYTRIGFLGTPFVFGLYVYQGLLRGWGDSRTPMYIVAGSVVLNVLIDPFFVLGFRNNLIFEVFGLGSLERELYAATGFAGFGVEGAAIATVLARGLGAVAGIGLLLSGRVGLAPTLADFRPRREVVTKLVRVGVPASVELSTRSLGVAVLTALVAIASQEAVAAYSIGNRILALVFLPAVGLASGMETVVGQNLGAEQRGRVKRVVFTAAMALTAVLVLVSTVTIIFAEAITSLFISGENSAVVVTHGASYLRIVSVTFVFVGVFRVLQGAFRGSGSTTVAMGFSLGTMFVLRIPLAYGFLKWSDTGVKSVWYAIAASNIVVCLFAVGWFQRETWTASLLSAAE